MGAESEKPSSTALAKILKSTLVFKLVEGYKYSIKISHKSTTAVNIMKTIDPGPRTQNWMIRFDNAHKNANFPHLNLRQRYTGIKDPHLKLPPGSLAAAQGGAYIAKVLDWCCYITLVMDGIQLGKAIYEDHKAGTMNNTAECAVDKSGQYIGGIVGAVVGKTVGSFLIPGIGPLVGAFALGIVGVKYGRDLGFSCLNNYRSENELKMQREKEIREMQKKLLYISSLHVNPFCD